MVDFLIKITYNSYMDIAVLCLVITWCFLLLVPENRDEKNNDNRVLAANHCDVHKWVKRPTGFKEEDGFETHYTMCCVCGYVIKE